MEQVFAYVIGLGASVMMPVIFTGLGCLIGIKFSQAHENSKTMPSFRKSALFVAAGVDFWDVFLVTLSVSIH